MIVDEYESCVRIAEARIAFWGESTDSNDVLKSVINQDLREIIELSVNKLPPKCAQAFRLAYSMISAIKEIAEDYGNLSPYSRRTYPASTCFLRKDLKGLFLLIFLLCNIN